MLWLSSASAGAFPGGGEGGTGFNKAGEGGERMVPCAGWPGDGGRA